VARRSPLNARYQKFQEPPGKTRKSAAAAKPTRKQGSSATSTSSAKSKTGAKGKGSTARIAYDPPTPEFRRLRVWWWSLLGGGVVLVLVSWGVRQLTHLSARMQLATLALGLAYFCIGVAFYLDFVKMRPLRNEWRASQSKTAGK